MSNVQSIERAFTILKILSQYPNGLRITNLAQKAGLSKSTAHRIASTLVNLEYVYKNPETEKYILGNELIRLTGSMLSNLDVIKVADPYLTNLSRSINETVHLCVEDNGEVLYVDKKESNQRFRMYSTIGSRGPLYCSAVGKILLSGMEESYFNEVINNIKFIARTERTITSIEELKKEIKKVKLQGYALDDKENEEGLRCIGGPIYDFKGNTIASFSISGPASRLTLEKVENELAEKIKITSKQISEEFGYVTK
ncbi:IclR family transcriptional regulator [Oceanobacillus jeddahense]|uniref:IclR family transcriptional regulator n=1 Tax=Oceanobacillus jeddahense TaxID=1462527 RepID=UPI003641F9DF